ncbi:MAG TPA: LamG-like jellyroll fold domain-containing protein [Cyclobacteriaceae bacterium]|nr:LamG-like jellyroll fold domain-containing protein [Cyclobacteriaceae bacterium]
MRKLLLYLFILAASPIIAQTGPGGVGNSSSNVLWLKADAGTNTTTNFGAVSSWTDASGNSNNASQPTAAKQPLYSTGLINGMPALFFDNTSGANYDEMFVADNSNLDNTAGLTILTVSRPISIDGNARAVISKRVGVGDQQSYTMFFYASNRMHFDVDGNGNRFLSNTVFQAGRDYMVSLLFDGALVSTSRSKVYVNETLDITATETSAAIPDFASTLTIGSMNPGDNRPFGGYIAEIIIYRKALNTPERIIAHNYLMAKYGFNSSSVPAVVNDFYVGDEPGNGNYDFEMAGIGIDATGSNLSAATSVTGGMGITQQSGFDNGDYLLYAHQAGLNFTQTSDVGGMTGPNNGRWNRIWFVDVTNTSTTQTVDIAFDMSDASSPPVTPVTASNYVLLTRSALSGNWTEVTTATSIVGDVINFPNISIAADAYYTLGSRDYVASPLPVNLIDFTGMETEKGVDLRWTTGSEKNNDHFTIERSNDGHNFHKIAVVKGYGTRSTETSYEALDREPLPGRSYYRLLQTDFDGKTANLKTIAVTTSERGAEILIVPNPSDGIFWFDLPLNITGSHMNIIDSSGQPVNVNYTLLGSRVSVDAQHLPKGLYILKLITNRGVHAAKFIIE